MFIQNIESFDIIHDKDLDGLLSAYYLRLLYNDKNISFLDSIKKSNKNNIITLDKAFDIVRKEIESSDKKIKNLIIFDHHVFYKTYIHNIANKIIIHLELFAPTTLSIVKDEFRNKEVLSYLLKNYRELIKYLYKVENEIFRFNEREKSLYFSYFSLYKLLEDKPIEEKVKEISKFLKKTYLTEKAEKLYRDEVFDNIRYIQKNNNYLIFSKTSKPLYNIPFFFKDSNFLFVQKLESGLYKVVYRFFGYDDFFDYLIRNYVGGGRKSPITKKHIGTLYTNDKGIINIIVEYKKNFLI